MRSVSGLSVRVVNGTLQVAGDLDVNTCHELERVLADVPAQGDVFVDLAAVDFIDSTGLSVLLNALRRVTRQHGTLALAVSNPTVLRLFEITRLDSTFDILPDRDAAIARVRRGQAADGSNDGAP